MGLNMPQPKATSTDTLKTPCLSLSQSLMPVLVSKYKTKRQGKEDEPSPLCHQASLFASPSCSRRSTTCSVKPGMPTLEAQQRPTCTELVLWREIPGGAAVKKENSYPLGPLILTCLESLAIVSISAQNFASRPRVQFLCYGSSFSQSVVRDCRFLGCLEAGKTFCCQKSELLIRHYIHLLCSRDAY